jgi:hypothetical protein
MRVQMRAIGTRLRVKHLQNLVLIKRALMLCLEATHNVSMLLRRVNVLERGFYRLRLAVIAIVVRPNGTSLFAFIGKLLK